MSTRIASLDGLRGLAAAVVVVHHSFLVAPAFGNQESARLSPSDGWTWWAEYTPLATLWNGGAAVMVFFVLSGFVLAIPFLDRGRGPSWVEYYPRRVARLYLPVWAAVAVAMGLFLLFPRRSDPSQSWWVNRHDVPLAVKPMLADMVLVRGTSWYNSALWSLQYEVFFSLLLPIILLVVLRLHRLWIPLLMGLVLAIYLGESLGNGFIRYMPVFAIGVVLAVRKDVLDRAAHKAPTVLWIGMLLLSIPLMSPAILPFTTPNLPLIVVGSTLTVVVFYGWSSARRLGETDVMQWLGKRSFSLYLTHEPVIVSLAVVTGWTDPMAVLAVAFPISLLVAAAFYRIVEAPSHEASRWLGRRVVERIKLKT